MSLIRGCILLGWFFALIAGQNALIFGPFETQFHCEFEAGEVRQLLHKGLVIRASATTDCWEG